MNDAGGADRVTGARDVSMTDRNNLDPPLEYRPTRKFLGVQVPTHGVEPNFHKGARLASIMKGKLRAIKVVRRAETEKGESVFVLFDDNIVRQVPLSYFSQHHQALLDAFVKEEARKGSNLHKDSKTASSVQSRSKRGNQFSQFRIQSSIATSSGDSIIAETNEDDSDGDIQSVDEELESASGSFTEESSAGGQRRNAPRKANKITRYFEASPPKRRMATRSGLRRREGVPATSGSDVESAHSRLSSSDDEIIEIHPNSNGRPNRDRKSVRPFAAPTRTLNNGKPRAPRGRRPIKQDYGDIIPISELESRDDDVLQKHRPTCTGCLNSPAHEILRVYGKRARHDIVNMGGWIQCLRCTEASHWKCLTPNQQTDILRAARAREQSGTETGGGELRPLERQAIAYNEATGYICISCSQKEFCLGCQRELKARSPVSIEASQRGKVTSVDSVDDGDSALSQGILMTGELFFRCVGCKGVAHYAHLQSPFIEENPYDPSLIDDIALHYQNEYQWRCDVCSDHDSKVDKIIAWRPYPPNATLLSTTEVEERSVKDPWPREYLVKWENKSYRRTSWVPHLWLVSTAYLKLRHFILHGPKVRLEHLRSVAEGGSPNRKPNQEGEMARRRVYEDEDGPPMPNPRAEECIPDPWKRIEQVLDVLFLVPYKSKARSTIGKRKGKESRVVESSEESEKGDQREERASRTLEALRERSRISGELLISKDDLETPITRRRRKESMQIEYEDIDDVVWCFAKWGELEYQEATWDTPPRREDPEWPEFEAAFTRYVQSQAVFVAKIPQEELAKRDDRNPSRKGFQQNNMEISQSYVSDQGRLLRPFQVEGVNWLTYQWWRRSPAILADEMGLGKTVQIITFLAKLVEKKIWPHLVVVPNSTILNWIREFQTWAPNIRVVPYYGEAASRNIIRQYEIFHSVATSGQTKLKLHVLVTTYETFLNKNEWATVFKAPTRWETLVIDEGQRLKNNESLLFRRLNDIPVGHRVLMTGTPLNNNLRELFNLMNFIDPDEWDDLEGLEKQYRQDQLTTTLISDLHGKLKNYFLRRTKDILKLPNKHEIIVPVSLSKLQKSIYKSLIESNLSLLNSLLNKGPSTKNSKASRTNLRNILMQSRKCVQHPYLVEPDLEPASENLEDVHRQLVDASGKLKFLQILLARLKARGRRVLLFSQFVIALDIIEDFIVAEGYKFLRLDGDLKSSMRQKDIDRFNAPGSDYFIYLLSTRAGGVGINLASADTVIIFDPDFNPHQDAQAISRAHRFGQKKPVIVFRVMATMGPEQKIMHVGKKKLLLDHLIVQNMRDEEEAPLDVESMLLAGAKSLFEGGEENDIVYTDASVDALIENAEVEASKPRESTSESSGMTFEFAHIWESSNGVLNDNEEEADTDFWSKMIEQAQEEKEKKAAEEAAESGRGAQRKAKATVTYAMAWEDSPDKKKVKRAKKKADSDVEYQEQGAQPLTSSDDETPYQWDNLVPEIGELEVPNLSLEEMQRIKQLQINQRERQKVARLEAKALLSQPPTYQYHVYGSAIGSASTSMPNSHSNLGTGINPLKATSNGTSLQYMCPICSKRHELNNCPAIKSVETLKQLRARLLESSDNEEDKRIALQHLNKDIMEKERENAAALRKVNHTLVPNVASGSGMSQTPVAQIHPTSITTSQVPNVSRISTITAKDDASTRTETFTQNIVKKRLPEGTILNERPHKKINTGAPQNPCILCKQGIHPAIYCGFMKATPAQMKLRLDQLSTSPVSIEEQTAINTLRARYRLSTRQPEEKMGADAPTVYHE